MPVDLSMIGLKGIAAGQDTLNSIAQREALQSQTAIQQGEFDRENQALELDRLAVEQAKTIMAGEGRQIGGADTTEDDMARFMAITGGQLAAAGAPKRGAEMMEASLDLTKKKADIDKVADEQEKIRLDNMITAGDYMYNLFADAQNENEYQVALAQVPENVVKILGADNVNVLRNTPWSPELQDYFKVKSLSTKEQAQLEMTAQGHRRQEQQAADLSQFRRTTTEINRQRAATAERAQAAAEKAGGANISKAPTSDERRVAEDALVNIVGSKIKFNDDALFNASSDIVGEAKRLLADTPGITFAEAVQRAVLSSQAAGELGHLSVVENEKTKKEETVRGYKPRGRIPENALSLPTGDIKQVQSKLIKGRYYNTPMGTLKWDGTEFK